MSTLLKERSTYWLIGGGSNPASDGDFRPYWRIYYDQEPQNNRTLITVQYYLQIYASGADAVNVGITSTVRINGSSIGTITKSATTYSTSGLKSIGSKTTYITHEADGTAQFTFQGTGSYGSWSKNTAVSTYDLPTLPRYATCYQNLVNKSETQITMNWSSDSIIDYVWYSIDNGLSWVAVGNTNSTSGSYTITGLSASTTYNIKTRVRRADSQLTTDSSNSAIATYAIPTQGIIGISETAVDVSWSAGATANYVWYSTDNGSTWVDVGVVNSSSGSYSITGLSPNTSYNIKTKVRLSATNTVYENGTIAEQITTFDYPYCVSTPDFNLGETLTIGLYNPLRRSVQVTIIGDDGSSLSADVTTSDYISGYRTDSFIDVCYKSIPNLTEGTYKVKVISGIERDLVTGGVYKIDESLNRPIFEENYFTIQDVNSKTVALTGDPNLIVNNYSTVRVNVNTNAIAKNYATMQYYIINGIQYNYFDSFTTATAPQGDLKKFNSSSVSIFAKDSRGILQSQPAIKPVVFVTNTNGENYFNITKKDNQSYVRSNQGVGEQVTFSFEGTWWNGNFGTVANSLEASYEIYNNRTKVSTTGETTINIVTNENEYSFSGVLYGDTNNGFDIESSYNVSITIKDKLSETTFNYVVIEGSPAIALYGNCVALGGPYDETLGGRVQLNNVEKLHMTNGFGKITVDEIKVKNLFNIQNLTFVSNASINYSTGTITVNQYANASQQTLKELCPDMVAGETYMLSFKTTSSSNFIHLYGSSTEWFNGQPRTITEEELNDNISFYGDSNGTGTWYIEEIQIEKGDVKTKFAPHEIIISEKGSNEKGYWVKYSDGTMYQWGHGEFGTSGTLNDSYALVVFPQTFSRLLGRTTTYTPTYKGSIDQLYTLFTILTSSNNDTKQDYVYRRLSYTTNQAELLEYYKTAISFNWFATGYWK